MPTAPRRLVAVLEERLRLRHSSPRTVEAYCSWVRRYVRFHRGTHPREMGEREVTAFLSDLATRRQVSASTQNQALAALLFLYRDVLDTPVGWLDKVIRAKRPHRTPTVLSRHEVARLMTAMSGTPRLVAMVLYGGGLRLGEALSLRVKDVDLDRGELSIRHGKGGRDRVTMVPDTLREPSARRLNGCVSCIGVTSQPVAAQSRCRGRSMRNHPVRHSSFTGSGCFQRRDSTAIQRVAGGSGTICTTP